VDPKKKVGLKKELGDASSPKRSNAFLKNKKLKKSKGRQDDYRRNRRALERETMEKIERRGRRESGKTCSQTWLATTRNRSTRKSWLSKRQGGAGKENLNEEICSKMGIAHREKKKRGRVRSGSKLQ